MQREKQIRSGPLLEVDFYPVFDSGRKMPTRAPKTKPSTDAQKRYNNNEAVKKLIHLVNTNFDESDYFMHPTYDPLYAPKDIDEARRDLVNYLRRMKTKRAAEAKLTRVLLEDFKALAEAHPKNKRYAEKVEKIKAHLLKLEEPLKYIYVIEEIQYMRGIYAGLSNFHFHLFITGGVDRRTVEKMWPHGIRVNCSNYQPETFGPEAAAKYMAKDPKGSKRFSYSKNLKKPDIKTKDGKISRATVSKVATQRVDDKDYWEKRYKGYRLLRTYNRFNEYNGHWYVTAVMYKTDADPPKWDNSIDWLTSDGPA